VVACGAVPVVMSAAEHDEAVALVSHAPQVVASVLAAQLRHGASRSLELSGQGIRDTVRIAASDPQLWAEILRENAAATATVLRGVIGDLEGVVEALETIAESVHRDNDESTISASRTLVDLLRRGNEGYARIPGKHGSPPATYAHVPVVIPDEPGALAALFLAAGRAGVNVEDVHIEHSAGQPVGLVELAVAPTAAAGLAEQLRAGGWSVH